MSAIPFNLLACTKKGKVMIFLIENVSKSLYLCRQSRFYKVQTTGELPEDLSDKLNNGRGLTLFFHGIKNIIPGNGMN